MSAILQSFSSPSLARLEEEKKETSNLISFFLFVLPLISSGESPLICWRSYKANFIAMSSRSRFVGSEALRMVDLSIPSTSNSFSSEKCSSNSCRRLSSSREWIIAERISTNAVLIRTNSIAVFESAARNSLAKRSVFCPMRSYWGNGVVFTRDGREEKFWKIERWTPLSDGERVGVKTREIRRRMRKGTIIEGVPE